MSDTAQSVEQLKNPLASALGISCGLLILFLAALLHVLGISLAISVVILTGATLLWIMLWRPMVCLGAFLAVMPVFPLAVMLGEYFGPHYISWASAFSRVVLVLLICVLWRRNGLTLQTPDWFALSCFGLAMARLAFGGMLISLLADFNCMIAYTAGRVTVLPEISERRWAKRAVWIIAVLSVLGMTEVFIFGEGPRAALYMAVTDGEMTGEGLNPVFHAEGFGGLRESATMVGPLTFASLCMIGLFLWWLYCRNPLPAAMIAAGLVCSVTRSAWVGTALAIPLLAVLTKQMKRFLIYAALALGLFIVSIPLLGLGDYLFLAKSGQDYSTQGHQESILQGLQYVAAHPFGSGPGTAGAYATQTNSNGAFFESTYLTLAAEYGILATMCFLAFLVSAFRQVWRVRTPLGYAAVSILVGFGAVMMVAPLHLDFPLATWIWFPVGLAVRSSGVLLPDPGSATDIGPSYS